MDCFVCNDPAEIFESSGDFAEVSCDECGAYRVSGTVTRMLSKGRWLHTDEMKRWISVQHEAGEKAPMINDLTAMYDGAWNPEFPTSLS